MLDVKPPRAEVSAPIARMSHPVRTFFCSLGFALSYWFLPEFYWLYRIEKRLFNALFRMKTPVLDAPRYVPDGVVIQGFRHSGNSFIISNIVEEDQGRLPGAWHRLWTLKTATDLGLPVVVLIRQPGEVVASSVYRATTGDNSAAPYLIYPWALILAWIGYYRWIKRFRMTFTVLPLDLIARDYHASRKLIGDRACVRMNVQPDWTYLNRYEGLRWDLKLSSLSRHLLRSANALYSTLVDSPQ